MGRLGVPQLLALASIGFSLVLPDVEVGLVPRQAQIVAKLGCIVSFPRCRLGNNTREQIDPVALTVTGWIKRTGIRLLDEFAHFPKLL